MSLRYVVRVLLLAGLAPSAALALGLGDIHLGSPLNAPLQADIDLSASADELDGLKVGLASRDTFARYGLEYPAFLGGITLEPGKDAAGRNVIHVRSRDAITEPFATLLIEASWPRGRLVREYTVLLDPPTFTGAAGNAAAVATPETAAPARAGAVQRPEAPPAPQPAPAPAAPAAVAAAPRAPAPLAAPAVAAAPGDYPVRRGETLSGIVAHHYNNGERDRALVATFKANPSAFAGNMNVLKAGATLHLPDAAAVAAIGPAEASSEVLAQYRSWSPAKPGGQLKLVAPSPPPPPPPVANKPAPAPVPAKPVEPAAGQPKAAPQPDKGEAARLLELKNAELARLQSLQAQQPKPPVAPPVAAQAVPAKPAPAVAPPPAKVEPPQAEVPAAEVKKPLPKPVAAPAEPSSGLLDLLVENWLYVAGAVVLIIAGLFGMKLARSRQSQRMERTFENFTSPPPEPAMRAVRATEATTPIKALQSRDDQGFLVEESGTHEILALDQDALGDSVQVESPVPAESTVSLEQGDPLAEADFHMAYGLYDQAADLVRLGISREPGRHDLKLKLLEVYFVWGNKDQFLQLARELAANRAATPAGEWEKVLIMGRQIAADDPLFSSRDRVAGAAAGGVDLNLEGGQNHVDFDLLGEPTLAPGSKSAGVDLDLGAALGTNIESTSESPTIGDTGVDFILDDPQRGADGTGITREMPNQTASLEFDGDLAHDLGLPGDAPTIEQPRLPGEDNNTLRTKLDASSRSLLAGVDQTTELALDDLGLDLSADATGLHSLPPLDATGESMTTTLDPHADSAPTQLTSLSEDTRTLMARASGEPLGTPSAPIGKTQEMPAVNDGTSGTWLITDQDFSDIMTPAGGHPGDADAPTQLMARPAGDGGETGLGLGLTSQIESLRAGGKGVDLDLDGLDATSSTGTSPALDLDLGSATAQVESNFSDTQRLDAITIPPPANTVEPATMSEVGTKLDLARAYMDMGDPEGARSILEEVLSEGSASQKTEARRLIDSLPGLIPGREHQAGLVGRIALGLEYDGAAFHGWQVQAHCHSVQAEAEAALGSVAGHPVALTIAGRTDAGVHARGQVAHFDSEALRPERGWVLGANAQLPPTVSVRWVRAVPGHFHARYSATGRSYRYLILNRHARSALAAGRCLVVHPALDVPAMQAAAALLEGEHDFSAFRAAECQARSPVRRLGTLRVERSGNWVTVEAGANAFLHHMVRNIVGLLLLVGKGAAPPARAREQLESRQRHLGAATAPAQGLYFWQAHYPPEFGLPDDSAMIGAPGLPAG